MAQGPPPAPTYVHGYSEREARRLRDQAASVRELIHHDTELEPGSLVLEVGCGVGAQTVAEALRNPAVRFISFDRVIDSVTQTAGDVVASGAANVPPLCADPPGSGRAMACKPS